MSDEFFAWVDLHPPNEEMIKMRRLYVAVQEEKRKRLMDIEGKLSANQVQIAIANYAQIQSGMTVEPRNVKINSDGSATMTMRKGQSYSTYGSSQLDR